MEAKDWLVIVGLIVTFVITIINIIVNIRQNKRTTFINTVTSERVKWIEKLRKNISAFCGLSHHWALTSDIDSNKKQEILEQLDKLRWEIKLQLNPQENHYIKIKKYVDKIPDLTTLSQEIELKKAIENLIEASQLLLKEEWDKVKEEAKKGDLKIDKKKWYCLIPWKT